mmetsp:Transcript_46689/g.81240  ORF Transcript_46689/g.81240 Transcript_46689/m.81240 type:complete len:125 (+) Transcript_46689:33-407(+)
MGAMATILGGGDPDKEETWKESYGKVVGSGITEKEQLDAMQRLRQDTRDHVSFLPQKAMNSYDDSYTNGDWIAHFAGSLKKKELVAKYAAKLEASKDSNRLLQAAPSHSCGDVQVRLSGWSCAA